jgi:hypothetical protein
MILLVNGVTDITAIGTLTFRVTCGASNYGNNGGVVLKIILDTF